MSVLVSILFTLGYRYGLQCPQMDTVTRDGRRKLTAAQREEIFRRVSAIRSAQRAVDDTVTAIATEFGVTRRTVYATFDAMKEAAPGPDLHGG